MGESMMVPRGPAAAFAALAAMVFWAPSARAIDIPGVLFAALDQPRMTFYVAPGATSPPLAFDLDGEPYFTFQAFLDTGASGLLMSAQTADFLGVPLAFHNDEPVVFSDHGVGGAEEFFVSEPMWVGARKYTSIFDEWVPSIDTYDTDFPAKGGPFRLQVGPSPEPENPLLQGLDVFGMPIIHGRVIVVDVRPTGRFDSEDFSSLDIGKTYLYEPGTPANIAGQETDDPGIPAPAFSVKVSKADFTRFTSVTPVAAGFSATVFENPFIGPKPRGATLPIDNTPDPTPSVQVTLGARQTRGSFLLDTGAAVSMISRSLAGELGVRYVSGTEGTEAPELEFFDPDHPEVPGTPVPPEQMFVLDVGGIGGTVRKAGLYFDSMLLSTLSGIAYDASDPRNLNFLGAPLLINDITLADPTLLPTDPNYTFTLDGIFGMNFVYGTIEFEGSSIFDFAITNVSTPRFDFFTYDDPNGTMSFAWAGRAVVPEPSTFAGLGLMGLLVGRRLRRRV